jgi:hypothetical protein
MCCRTVVEQSLYRQQACTTSDVQLLTVLSCRPNNDGVCFSLARYISFNKQLIFSLYRYKYRLHEGMEPNCRRVIRMAMYPMHVDQE